jgi:hypothetical protein
VKLIRKNFGDLKTNFRSKFVKCTSSSLQRGDYLHIVFVLKNQKRKRGLNLRLNNLLFVKKMMYILQILI